MNRQEHWQPWGISVTDNVGEQKQWFIFYWLFYSLTTSYTSVMHSGTLLLPSSSFPTFALCVCMCVTCFNQGLCIITVWSNPFEFSGLTTWKSLKTMAVPVPESVSSLYFIREWWGPLSLSLIHDWQAESCADSVEADLTGVRSCWRWLCYALKIAFHSFSPPSLLAHSVLFGTSSWMLTEPYRERYKYPIYG